MYNEKIENLINFALAIITILTLQVVLPSVLAFKAKVNLLMLLLMALGFTSFEMIKKSTSFNLVRRGLLRLPRGRRCWTPPD